LLLALHLSGRIRHNVWQLGACRLLAGIGIGGEWAMGGTYVAESWPDDRRKAGAGYMHSGYYFGFSSRALANFSIGAHYGWRMMFAIGGLPALLVSFIRYGVRESARWQDRVATASGHPTMTQAFAALFSKTYARRTALNSLFLLISVVGLWAGSVYVPASITQLSVRAGFSPIQATRLASYGTMVLSVGTILGCIALPALAERFGRRLTLGFYFLLMFFSISIGFGYVFYLAEHALQWFFVVCSSWAWAARISQSTHCGCRSSIRHPAAPARLRFTTSVGRFAGAGITFLVGGAVQSYGSLGMPVALTSLAFCSVCSCCRS